MSNTEMEIFPEKAKVVGIGKVIVSTSDGSKFNIPHLHFLVAEGFSKKGVYDSLNLEYGIHCSAGEPKEAFLGNYKRVLRYFELNKIDSPKKFLELIEEQDNHYLSDYWRVFRKTEMELATKKKDLGSALFNDLRKEIAQEIKQLGQSIDKKMQNIQKQLDSHKDSGKKTAFNELQKVLKKREEMDEILSITKSMKYTEYKAA